MATDLLFTSRRASLSSKAPWTYTLHRPDCRVATTFAKPLADRPDAERILRKARHGLNAKPCTVCKPDVA